MIIMILLASALQFLRSQNLVHRDIKPQVIIIIMINNNIFIFINVPL